MAITNTDPNHYKFTGKERDTESGLDNFGARYDASSLGRFLTPDWAAKATTVPYATFGDPQTLNLYAYVENGPLNRVDADGYFFSAGDFSGGESVANATGNFDTGNNVYSASPDFLNPEFQSDPNLHVVNSPRVTLNVQLTQNASASQTDKRTDVMLTPDSLPPQPSVTEGAQFEMDYTIVPQANTIQQLQDNSSNLRNDKEAQAKHSKMEVKLWESQRGGKWQWQGDH